MSTARKTIRRFDDDGEHDVRDTLAVEMAENLGITLIGHLRPTRMNVYTGAERIISDESLPNLVLQEELLSVLVDNRAT